MSASPPAKSAMSDEQKVEMLRRYQAHAERFDGLAARSDALSGRVQALPQQCRRPSERELAVLALIADGFNNQEIADRLFVSEETVKTHVRHVMNKLTARNRTHAVALAIRAGLIEDAADSE
jgi:DNA-binding NarL/FixJ family response regulator